jgi:hypothetical protein
MASVLEVEESPSLDKRRLERPLLRSWITATEDVAVWISPERSHKLPERHSERSVASQPAPASPSPPRPAKRRETSRNPDEREQQRRFMEILTSKT